MYQLAKTLIESADKALHFFESQMLFDGSYGQALTDVSGYYKSPMMFLRAGRPDKALQILDYAKTNFMQADGDFLSSMGIKSTNSAYTEFWTYITTSIKSGYYLINMIDFKQALLKPCNHGIVILKYKSVFQGESDLGNI